MAEQSLSPARDEAHRVCYPFPGDTMGGSHLTILTLLRGLDRSRFEPVVVLHRTGRFSRQLDELGIPYHLLPLPRPARRRAGPANAAFLLGIAPRLAGFIRAQNISLVHSSQNQTAQNWALAARLGGAPHLWDQRGRVTGSRLERLLRSTAQGLMVNSRHILGQLPPALQGRCRVIYPPIAVENNDGDRARAEILAEIPAEAGLPGEALVVGFFANLVERKRPGVFQEAAKIIARELPGRCVFVMFGDDRQGAAAGLLAEAEVSGLGASFRYLGFRRPGWYWVSGCQLILAPAVDEPFGRVLVEAMLAGVPVAAADSGGHAEIIEHGVNGRLARPDDPGDLAAQAVHILTHPESTAAMVARARDEAGRRFAAPRFVHQVQELYSELLGDAPRPAPPAD